MRRFNTAAILVIMLCRWTQAWATDLRPEEHEQIVGKVKSIFYYVENFDRLKVTNDGRPTKILHFDGNGKLVESFSGRTPMRTTYHYDDKGQLESLKIYDVKKALIRTAKVEHDTERGTETRRYYQDGKEIIVQVLYYDSNGRIKSSRRQFRSQDIVSERIVELFYDQDGVVDHCNIFKTHNYTGNNPDFKRMLPRRHEWFIRYEYNEQKQLKNAVTSNSRGEPVRRETYVVDHQGNWRQKTVYEIDQRTHMEKRKRIVTRKISY